MMANMADSGSERPFGQCRCCLSFGYHRDIEVARKVLLQTFNLLLATNTELTSMICTLCIRRLEDAVDFKSMILESEKELLKCLNKNSNNEFDNVAQTNDARVKEEYEGIVQEINDTDEEMNQDQNVKHEEMVQEHNSSHKEMDNDVDSDINDALLQDASKGTVQAKNDNQEEINQDQDVKNEEMMQGQNSTYTQNEIDSNVAEDSANNDNINVTNLQNDSDINKIVTCEVAVANQIVTYQIAIDKSNQHENNDDVDKNQTNTEEDGEIDEMKNEVVTRKETGDIDSDATNVDSGDDDNVEGQIDTLREVVNGRAIEQLFIVTDKQHENGFSLNNELKSTTDETPETLESPEQARTPETAQISESAQISEPAQISETTQIPELAHISGTAQMLKTVITEPLLPKPSKTAKIRITPKQRKRKSAARRTGKTQDAVSTRNTDGDSVIIVDINKELIQSKQAQDKTTELVKMFDCSKCKYTTPFARSLKSHIKAHLAPVKFICDTCHHISDSRSLFTLHFKKHTSEKPYTCKVCYKKFSAKGDFKKHCLRHTGVKKYTCDICEKSWNDKSDWTTHMRVHTGERPFGCKFCDKRFKQRGSLNNHMRIHTGEKSAPCKICGKEFTQNNGLVLHMKVHTGEKPFECEICHSKFTHRKSLVRHKNNVSCKFKTNDLIKSQTTKIHKCKTCNKDFSNRDTFYAHMKTHMNDQVYVCKICNNKFTDRSSFVKHVQTHTHGNISADAADNPYYCDICDKHFAKRQVLKTHLKVHTGERVASKKSYDCKICGKKLSRANTLDYHVRAVHMGEKPPSDKTYACEICDKKFSRRFNLEQHVIRVHTGKK